jgi:hypothetical protein
VGPTLPAGPASSPPKPIGAQRSPRGQRRPQPSRPAAPPPGIRATQAGPRLFKAGPGLLMRALGRLPAPCSAQSPRRRRQTEPASSSPARIPRRRRASIRWAWKPIEEAASSCAPYPCAPPPEDCRQTASCPAPPPNRATVADPRRFRPLLSTSSPGEHVFEFPSFSSLDSPSYRRP